MTLWELWKSYIYVDVCMNHTCIKLIIDKNYFIFIFSYDKDYVPLTCTEYHGDDYLIVLFFFPLTSCEYSATFVLPSVVLLVILK